jgi:hypothetical protein
MYEKAGFKRMAEFEGWPEGHMNVVKKSLFLLRSREDSENYVLSKGLPSFMGTIPPLKHNAFFRVWQPLSPRVVMS